MIDFITQNYEILDMKVKKISNPQSNRGRAPGFGQIGTLT